MSSASVVDGGPCPCGRLLARCRLLARLRQGVPLTQRPFADIGADCGLGEEQVLGWLRRLLGSGQVRHLGPLRSAGATPAAAEDWAVRLLDATASGLPLLPEPFEALGALLGIDEVEVRHQFRRLIECGAIVHIGVSLDGPPGGT